MALQLKQQVKLAQQLIMTPQLQQAIKLLQMNRMELVEAIEQELTENPILETGLDQDESNGESDDPEKALLEQAQDKLDRDHTTEVEVTEDQTREKEIDWEAYLEEYNSPYQAAAPTERESRESVSFENFISAEPDLAEHLNLQLQFTDLNDQDKRIGAEIIGNIRPDGYLGIEIEDLAGRLQIPVDQLEEVLAVIQTFDPAGIGARDLRECLLIQLAPKVSPRSLVYRIVDQALDKLGNRNYKALTKKFGCSMDDLAEAIDEISVLDPKPGRNFSSETAQYISPDIYIVKIGDKYEIMLNEDGLPKLKINSFYRRALTNPGSVSSETKEYIQERMRSAQWLIRSIHQRQRTIFRVTESIVKRQRAFLDHGVAYLKPMVLKDVAEDVEMHESTISRVTTNKYVHTPQGVFELKYFFNSAINRFHGEALASESVKERIKKIIEGEDPAKPLSDDAVKRILEAENVNIARRTVAKYRELLNILPSSKRKNTLLARKQKK